MSTSIILAFALRQEPHQRQNWGIVTTVHTTTHLTKESEELKKKTQYKILHIRFFKQINGKWLPIFEKNIGIVVNIVKYQQKFEL